MKIVLNSSECDTSQWFKLLEYVAHCFLTFVIVLPYPGCHYHVIQFLHAANLVPKIVTKPVGKLLFIYKWCLKLLQLVLYRLSDFIYTLIPFPLHQKEFSFLYAPFVDQLIYSTSTTSKIILLPKVIFFLLFFFCFSFLLHLCSRLNFFPQLEFLFQRIVF